MSGTSEVSVLKKILGVVFIIGAVVCTVGAYSSAGGMHGFNSFSVSRLTRPTPLLFTLGAATLLVVGVLALRSPSKG